jgi:hypothetical protein
MARATGPGPLRVDGRRAGVRRGAGLRDTGLLDAGLLDAGLPDAGREDLDAVDRDGVRVEALPLAGFLVEEVPEVRLRGGALDRLAMSREYP